MAYTGAGGRQFMSSVLAKASRPGGYTRTVSRVASMAPTRARTRTATPTPAAGGVNKEALAAIQRAKAYYEPGGGFGRGVEAGLERGRVKAVSGGMQNLVSAGLAGTTMAGGLGKRFEEEVAAPTRAGVEEQRAQAVSGIEMQEAGMRFQAGQAGLQRGFQATQSSAQRALQMYLAQMRANLERESMALRDQPVTTASPQAQQFPSLYGEMTEPSPSLMGGDEISGLSPASRMFQRGAGGEERFDIDFGPGTLAG